MRSKVASSSKAKISGILAVEILRRGFWLNALPFKNFHGKEIWSGDIKFQPSNLQDFKDFSSMAFSFTLDKT